MVDLRYMLEQTLNQGELRPRSRRRARFEKRYAALPASGRIGLIQTGVSMSLMQRLTGVYEKGAIAALYGQELSEQLAGAAWRKGDVGDIITASIVCILHADGLPLSDEARAALAGALRDATKPFDTPLYPALRGLSALLLGAVDVWTDVAAAAVDVKYEPHNTLGPNLLGLVAYLGQAQSAGASFNDVESALRNFIATYSSLSDAGYADEEMLILVGLVCGSVIGDMPLEDALDWFGAYLCEGFGLER